MGLISEMHKGKKGAPVGKKLPVPTTDGDDTVIAAKTGEYVLPPEVVAMIGVDKLDAMVAQMTGQPPGGKPAEMPEGMEMMQGEMPDMEGMDMMGKQPMMGHARGGLISQIEKGLSNAMTVGASLMPDPVAKQKAPADPLADVRRWMPDPFVATAAEPMTPDGLAPMDDKRRPMMGFAKGGLISHMMKHDPKMMGYNDGGFIEDDVRRRLSGYNPQSSVPPNATTNASPRAPELRNFTPEPGRLQPGATTPRITGLAAEPAAAPLGTPSRTVAELNARAAGRAPVPPQGVSATSWAPSGGTAPTGVNYDIPPGQRASVNTATMADFEAAQRAKAGVPPAGGTAAPAGTAPSAPAKPGLAYRAGNTIGKLAKATGAKYALPIAMNAGVNQSFADLDTGYRDEFNRSVGAESPTGTLAADTVRTLANVGDAVSFGLAGRVGRGIASATGGGSFGEGFVSPSDRERFEDSKRPTLSDLIAPNGSQQVAQAPTSSAPTAAQGDVRRVDPSEPAKPAGPISGLAARAQRQAPAAPQAARPDTSGVEAALAASPIASVQSGPVGPEGANGHIVSYKDGRQAFVNALPDDAKQWYALTGQVNGDRPVEVIKGSERFVASPESGFQAVPKFVADAGMIPQYRDAAAQGWVDAAAPQAAESRNRIAEIAAQGDNSIRVSNATDRDGKGRGLRNQLAEIELQQRQQIAELEKQALAGNQEAVQRIQQLQQLRSRGDNDGRAKLVTDLVKAYSGSAMQPVGADGKPMSLEQYVNQGLALATGTVQSSSNPPPQKGAVVKGYRFNGGDPGDRANWSKVQ